MYNPIIHIEKVLKKGSDIFPPGFYFLNEKEEIEGGPYPTIELALGYFDCYMECLDCATK